MTKGDKRYYQMLKEKREETKKRRFRKVEYFKKLMERPPLKESYPYIAGLFDGEGTICILKLKRRSGEYTLSPYIGISNNNKGCLDFAKKVGFPEAFQRADVNHACFQTRACKMELILDILIRLKPLLIVKRKQADLMIQFCLRRILLNSRSYSKEVWDMLREMKNLNHGHWEMVKGVNNEEDRCEYKRGPVQ